MGLPCESLKESDRMTRISIHHPIPNNPPVSNQSIPIPIRPAQKQCTPNTPKNNHKSITTNLDLGECWLQVPLAGCGEGVLTYTSVLVVVWVELGFEFGVTSVPQYSQNRAISGSSEPQFGQYIITQNVSFMSIQVLVVQSLSDLKRIVDLSAEIQKSH